MDISAFSAQNILWNFGRVKKIPYFILQVSEMKIVLFANSIDPDEASPEVYDVYYKHYSVLQIRRVTGII